MAIVGLIEPSSQPPAEAAVEAVKRVLKRKGEEVTWPAIVEGLSSALAYAIFAGMPDPRDDLVRDVLRCCSANVLEEIRQARAKLMVEAL